MKLLILGSVIFLAYVHTALTLRNNLSCYICHAEDVSLCTEEDLRKCPDDQAYDSCMTVLKKNVHDGFVIEKSCALGPCRFDNPAIVESLGLSSSCDRSKEEYYCMDCCRTSGCNKDAASGTFPAAIFVFGLGVLALMRIPSYFHQ